MVSRASLKSYDPDMFAMLQHECERQEYSLEMIPSENFVSEAVLEVLGSVATNKYAEGLPHKRYYGGCHYVDQMEDLAIDRAKQLFGCEFVNVQPHSGAQANQAVFEALLERGDTIMGMRLDMGGHLTHGSPVNFSGKHYKVVAYGVTKDAHLIDPDEVLKLAREHKPKLIITGASAYSRHIDFDFFRTVADEVGAILMADIAHYAGLIAGGAYPSPIKSCDVVTTTTHKTLRGPRSGMIMAKEKFAKAINKAVFPGLQGGPHMHTIAAKAVAYKEALEPSFKEYAHQIVENARALADELMKAGFKIISGGTDSHVMLVDLRPFDVNGKEAEAWLDQVGITCNKNGIPYDPQPPMVTSGIRLGTPALTTRGMTTSDMRKIAHWIKEAINARGDEKKFVAIRGEVRSLCEKYPLYKHRLVS